MTGASFQAETAKNKFNGRFNDVLRGALCDQVLGLVEFVDESAAGFRSSSL